MSIDKLEQYFQEQASEMGDDGTQLRREVAYLRIKDAIQHAALEPGDPLSEVRLSKILGLSRTPVREALQQLAQEGLVEVIPGQAITVASHSLSDVLNAVHMRALLEPELARLASESISVDAASQLDDAVSRMETAIEKNDFVEWGRANSIYHDIMAQACPNQLLGDTVLQMYSRVHHLANIDSQSNPERLTECTREHRRIANAIIAHDTAEAEQAMRDHIAALRNSLFKRLSFGYHSLP